MELFDHKFVFFDHEDSDSGLSVRGRIIKEILSEFNQKERLRHRREEERSVSEAVKAFSYPDQFEVKPIQMENFYMELLHWEDSDNPFVILQLHGGGYVGALKRRYRVLAGYYSEVSNHANILTVDYRVAPANIFPAALEDAYAAYHWLLDFGYTEDKIIIAGDSAGGGLAMALCHYLKDHGEKLPAAILAMSPWTDLTASGSSYDDNYEIDPIFGNRRDSLIYDSEYIGDADPTNPYISPMFGDFTDFPPMLIQVGSDEMLLSDSETVAQKAKEAGCKVRFTKYEGMFHVFQMAATLMPESKKAWAEIKRFFDIIQNIEGDNRENPVV